MTRERAIKRWENAFTAWVDTPAQKKPSLVAMAADLILAVQK
jgi:hypothetical protein